jgi:hypothetical protein
MRLLVTFHLSFFFIKYKFLYQNLKIGPGQYELRKAYNIIKGGSSLANKSERFQNKNQEIPGPGAYEIENKENKISTTELKVNFLKF